MEVTKIIFLFPRDVFSGSILSFWGVSSLYFSVFSSCRHFHQHHRTAAAITATTKRTKRPAQHIHQTKSRQFDPFPPCFTCFALSRQQLFFLHTTKNPQSSFSAKRTDRGFSKFIGVYTATFVTWRMNRQTLTVKTSIPFAFVNKCSSQLPKGF